MNFRIRNFRRLVATIYRVALVMLALGSLGRTNQGIAQSRLQQPGQMSIFKSSRMQRPTRVEPINLDVGDPLEQGATLYGTNEYLEPYDPFDPYRWNLRIGMNRVKNWGGRLLRELGFRHSKTDGRHIGVGRPMQGTSWLNRRYYAGMMAGPMVMTQAVSPNVRKDRDLMGQIFLGVDWDHYWGTELRFAFATPELSNAAAPTVVSGDHLVYLDLNFIYYPLGDAWSRPYLRGGIGLASVDYPEGGAEAVRTQERVVSTPIGIGYKHAFRKFLITRIELTDNITWGGNPAGMHNLSLMVGIEWRFGVRPHSYYPWYPSRHYR